MSKTTISVAKGLCSPARQAITGTLKPYGVVVHNVREYRDDTLSQYMNCAEVTVNSQAAGWVEYLLLRSGRFQLLSKPVNPGNEKWALKWDRKMPKPWIEKGCDHPKGKRQSKGPNDGRRQTVNKLSDLWSKLTR